MSKYNDKQKGYYENYIKKNDLVIMAIRVTKEQRDKYHAQACAENKSLTQYIVDKLEGSA